MKIAIVTDIHEDIVSLEKAMRKIDQLKVDKIFCLGDISGFSVPHYTHYKTRNASACLALVRKNCEVVIPGNHDLHAAKRLPALSPVFNYPKDWYKLGFRERKEQAQDFLWLYDDNELNPLYTFEDIEYLQGIDEMHSFSAGNRNILLSHYAYPNIAGTGKTFCFDNYDYYDHFGFMKERNADVSIMGHMHPEGLYFVTHNKLNEFRYKKRALPAEPVCIVAPSITNRGEANGFLILDLNNNELEAQKI